MKKNCLIILIITFSILVSCMGQDSDALDGLGITVTTEEIIGEDLSFLNEKPLNILYMDDSRWGAAVSTADNMLFNYMTLSKLCQEELGFPLKFIKLSGSKKEEKNVFATYINAGNEADLIFPTQSMFYNFEPNYFYWGDRYIAEGIYMDLTPYLSRLCPEAMINFERYPYIKDICTVNGKIYALYAGIPEISAFALIIKNELLEEGDININTLNNFDAIYEFMDNLHQGNQPKDVSDKIVIYPQTLLNYATQKLGYDQVWKPDVLLRSDDEQYIPHLIEDTDLLDYIFEKFNRFFCNSYFTTDINLLRMKTGQQAMYISSNPIFDIKTFSGKYNEIFNHYSIVLLDDHEVYIDRPDRIRLIMVPSTSTQPEKSLTFMQWLMTDEDVADILTFGSQILKLKHYTFSDDGTIYPEQNNTIYSFCYLIANYSKKAYLCGNKDFDIIDEYREMTYNAHYPSFYELIESQHNHYTVTSEFSIKYNTLYSNRNYLLLKSLKELIDNPNSVINADNIKNELSSMIDTQAMINDYSIYIGSILESNEVAYSEE